MILRLTFEGSHSYYARLIEAVAFKCGVEVNVTYQKPYLYVSFEENETFLHELDRKLYISLYYKSVEIVEEAFGKPVPNIPHSIGLCPDCTHEMLDPASRRYFYPFTSCNVCSHQAVFITRYPFERLNSLLTIFKLCEECQEELRSDPFRKDYPLISCTACNIPLKLSNKSGSKVLYANEKDEYKQVFELVAAAIKKGERVLIKTMRGWRRFGLEPTSNVLLFKPSGDFLLLEQEKRALFSIERPMMYVTSANGQIINAVATYDGFTTLIGALLDREYIYFDEGKEFDLKLEFELPITFYDDPFYFINQHHAIFKKGVYPKFTTSSKTALLDEWLMYEKVIDRLEHFEEVETEEIAVFKDEEIEHPNIKYLDLAKSSFLSVLREHRVDEAIGVYVGEKIKFFYHKDGKTKEIFAFKEPTFEAKRAVVDRFKERYPDRFEAFIKESNFLLKAARLIGFEGDFEEFNRFSLSFGGKGGVSIDCRIEEGEFDWSAFYGSVMSFVLADADNKLIAYSLFESLADFLGNQAMELFRKTKVPKIALSGSYIANSAFFSRFSRNTRALLITNKEHPIDGVGAFGAFE